VAAETLTLPGLLARNSAVHGDKQAVVADGKSITYADLDRASGRLAARLVAAGVGKSSRLGLLMPNGTDWVLTAVAAARVGVCLVPLSTLLRPPELLAQLQTAAVTHLMTVREFGGRFYLAELEEIASRVAAITAADGRHPILPALRRVWSFEDLPRPEVDPALLAALGGVVRPADDLVILFTSGSRGAPKGVIHTHGGAIRATAAGLARRCVGPDERLYLPIPFFRAGGFSGGLMTTLVAGATLLTEAVPEPEKTVELLERERATLFGGRPDEAVRLTAHPRFASADLSSLRPGSLPEVLPPGQRPEPKARPNLFGMTESFGPYCGDRLDTDMPTSKQGSCGRPFEGIEVRVMDPHTRIDVPCGAVGEIRLRGPNMMRAICGRTREATFDEDGFYPTGDLGILDTDGYLWYHGRLDDSFKAEGLSRR
jgi:acyl-CoA synthetase (AMP-forming)/AMP-acid ligase II